jgi:hypothetical protein
MKPRRCLQGGGASFTGEFGKAPCSPVQYVHQALSDTPTLFNPVQPCSAFLARLALIPIAADAGLVGKRAARFTQRHHLVLRLMIGPFDGFLI